MIFDHFENVASYGQVSQRLARALAYARDFDATGADGTYPIDGDDLYALVVSYETEPAAVRTFENHQRYIDVQVMLQGCERMDVALSDSLTPKGPYDADKDVCFFEAPAACTQLVVEPGTFAVFFPQDAHRPNCQLDGPSANRKLVVKVRV